MKKLLFALLAFTFYAVPIFIHAQTSCTTVDASNASFCCSAGGISANKNACDAYNRAVQGGYANSSSSSSNSNSTTSTTSTQTDPTKQCDRIYSFNKSYCCGTFRSQNKAVCDAYDGIEGYVPGQLNSSTNPSTQSVNTATTQGVIFDTPQAGAAELKQCSAIKFKSLLDILIWVKCIILVAIIPIIFALALMFFLWGVMKFIRASDSTKKEEGRKFIIAGLIGLFVMTSLWGIISIVSTTLGTGSAVPLLQTTYLK
jgi:hypothetical protein